MQTQRAMTVLQVGDLDRSLAFYGRLGFATTGIWGEPPGVAIVQRGAVSIMLQLADEVNTAGGRWSIYVYVDDVDTLNAELAAEGIEISGPPEDKYYGCRDIGIYDPDGHSLAFGQDLDPGPAGPGLSATTRGKG